MKAWSKALVAPSATIHDAIRAIDSSGMQIALVLDGESRLVGTVTDGDVRRALIRNVSLDEAVASIMNAKPMVASEDVPDHELLALMRRTMLRCIPIVDNERRVKRVAKLSDLMQPRGKDNPVVIMAGGLGSRLSPLTTDRPKPLLQVGERPILETMLESLRDFGFQQVYLSVNYKADMLKTHFGDGSRWGLSIRYLEEDQRLGTAGALALLPEQPTHPVLVLNADLLTKINYDHLLDFHSHHGAAATMCVREYDIQIPYGVVKIEDHRIRAIDEKPIHRFLVNGGIYVLEPHVLEQIPAGTYVDMPIIFERLISAGRETVVFPIREYWVDIGQLEDLERARTDYGTLFQ